MSCCEVICFRSLVLRSLATVVIPIVKPSHASKWKQINEGIGRGEIALDALSSVCLRP